MDNENTMLNNQSGSSKTPLVWFFVFLITSIVLMGVRMPELKNPWDNSLANMEFAISSNESSSKVELVSQSGKDLLAVQSVYKMHPILNVYVGYYFFIKGKMDSVIYYQTKALDNFKNVEKSKLKSQSRDLLVNAVINSSLKYISSGDSATAFKLYAKAISYAPENNYLNKAMAEFYIHQNKVDAALYHYYVALKGNKRDLESLKGIEKVYSIKGNTDSVRYYADAILQANPDYNKTGQLLDSIKVTK